MSDDEHPAVVEPTPVEAQAAYEVDQRIKQTIRKMHTIWLDLAKDFHYFSAGELWRDLGYERLEDWLGDPEIGLERRWFFYLARIYKTFILDQGLPADQVGGLHVSKLSEVEPAVRRGLVPVDEALSDCEVLSRTDIDLKYREIRRLGPDGRPGALDPHAEPGFARCPTCGSRVALEDIGHVH